MEKTVLPHDHGGGDVSQLVEGLSHEEDFQTVAELFKQLGDATRVRIFWLLCHCEECVINLSALLHMSSPAVSHHLRALRGSGLIVSRRDGKEVYYQASDTPQSRLLHQMIEQVLEIACPKFHEVKLDREQLTEYQAGQVELVRKIHQQLIEHMDQRITIEALAKQYLMNPTTLKALFKSVYGTSIAAHIKAHRMEEAARLLRETELSVAEIAGKVGYDSQSKFTTAFKAAFQTLPKEYRKKNHPAL